MNHLITPPPLQAGDQICIVSPAGNIDPILIDKAVERIKVWGFNPLIGRFARGKHGRFSGTVDERLTDLHTALELPSIKAILCARGGYGAMQLINGVDRGLVRREPKWIIGYSDITALHALWQSEGICSIHAPMVKHIGEQPADDFCSCSLQNILTGVKPAYEITTHPLNIEGHAEGVIRGGNLTLIQAMRGTFLDFPPDNTILFIEDIAERPYQIERILLNLSLGGVFNRLKGLIVGSFTDCEPDNSMPPVYEIVREIALQYNLPLCFGFPVGHTSENYPMICGASAVLNVESGRVMCRFL